MSMHDHQIYTKGSYFELAYASERRILPRRFNFDGAASDDERVRRYQGNSCSEEGNVLEEGRLFCEDYRVGGPNLCPLPVKTIPLSSDSALKAVLEKLVGLNVSVQKAIDDARFAGSFRFVERAPMLHDEESDKKVLTLLIVPKEWSIDSQPYVECASACLKLLDEEMARQPGITGRITVEITATESPMGPLTVGAIFPTPNLTRNWQTIAETIIALPVHGLNNKKAISCVRYGENPEPQLNPMTVVVAVQDDDNINWKRTREQILDIMAKTPDFNAAVKIVRDSFDTSNQEWTKKGINYDLSSVEPVRSESIGLRGSCGSGTLGGFIEIKRKGVQRSKICGITCFHCVCLTGERIPETPKDDNEDWERWNEHGITPEDKDRAKSLMPVDHPTASAGSHQVDFHNDAIMRIKTSAGQPHPERRTGSHSYPGDQEMIESEKELSYHELRKKMTTDFFSGKKHYFGYVWAGSGKRMRKVSTPTDGDFICSMDWALISIPKNRRPKKPNWIGQKRFIGQIAGQEILENLKGREIFKDGWATGHTRGICNGLITYKQIEDLWRKEYCIVTAEEAPTFAEHGDSGALVYTDLANQVVGLFFGKLTRVKLLYFTRIDWVFDDIRDMVKDTREVIIYQESPLRRIISSIGKDNRHD